MSLCEAAEVGVGSRAVAGREEGPASAELAKDDEDAGIAPCSPTGALRGELGWASSGTLMSVAAREASTREADADESLELTLAPRVRP